MARDTVERFAELAGTCFEAYGDRVRRWGTINEEEYKMLQFADTVDEAFDHIRAGLEKYHMDADLFLQAY